MNGRWVDESETPGPRLPGWLSPGLAVAAAFALLIAIVLIGVLISRRGGTETYNDLSIARLRSDPDRFDGARVELVGTVSNRYTIPILDQYGIYEFNDGTGSIFVLSDKGAPPDDGNPVRITAVFNGAVELDDQIKRLVEDQLGAAAGFIADQLLPGIPLNVTFLTHQRFEPVPSEGP